MVRTHTKINRIKQAFKACFFAMSFLCVLSFSPSIAQAQATNDVLQAVLQGDMEPREGASILAEETGVSFESLETVLDNFNTIQDLNFDNASELLNDYVNGQVTDIVAEQLSGITEPLENLEQIADFIESVDIREELERLALEEGMEFVNEQLAQIVDLAGIPETLQAAVTEAGASALIDALPDDLVAALGGEDALIQALVGAVGVQITLSPVNTTDPGGCTRPCMGTQDKEPTSVGATCSFGCSASRSCVSTINDNHVRIREHMVDEFEQHREWLTDVFWAGDHGILQALTRMTTQFTALTMQQVTTVGKFFDTKHQLETQRLMQALSTEAYRDYTPSEGLCEVGTNIRLLAASEYKSELTYNVVARRQLDRELRHISTPGATSNEGDKRHRHSEWVRNYCNKSDNANGLRLSCLTGSPSPETLNKDIDAQRTLIAPLTLDFDVSNTGASVTQVEEDIFALASNLYAHNVLPTIADKLLADGNGLPYQSAYAYMNYRSTAAKRSVATNNFAAIVGLKAAGDNNNDHAQFLRRIVNELGVSQDDMNAVLGERPSYYAQMDVLTKKLFQNPVFYTELYDKPTNVRRKGVALRAINLMQERDIYDSLLRSEATLAVTLETMLDEQQRNVRRQILNLPAVETQKDLVPIR